MLTRVPRPKPRRNPLMVLSHLRHALALLRGRFLLREEGRSSRGTERGEKRSKIALVNATTATLKAIGKGIVLYTWLSLKTTRRMLVRNLKIHD